MDHLPQTVSVTLEGCTFIQVLSHSMDPLHHLWFAHQEEVDEDSHAVVEFKEYKGKAQELTIPIIFTVHSCGRWHP